MSYIVTPTRRFEKDVDFYYRKKGYRKIEEDITEITNKLEQGHLLGNPIEDLNLSFNNNIYKVRAVNSSAKVGKSNGFRIIYYVVKDDEEIFLLTIYSKKDKENISNKDILKLIKQYII